MPESNATIDRRELPKACREEPDDAPVHGGLLVEVQSLVYWWLLSPKEACEIVDFPLERYRPRADGTEEPPYMPSPDEIERLCRSIRTGQLLLGGSQGKRYLTDPDEWEGDEAEPDDWP
ncbi:hypothetical protein [Rhodopirellula sallentina]|uniref:Uncharacterized protein n=1 Tax=Rhodopirellula sallentina SM41 TaxID=1263870 RepID=M5TTS8_9BACT|nr:hypothetical protein [Rhodopirellula sallentina]EMI52565.1 hypothetical protein RSSM_05998 [Rhodopirellula sallentina SM41]